MCRVSTALVAVASITLWGCGHVEADRSGDASSPQADSSDSGSASDVLPTNATPDAPADGCPIYSLAGSDCAASDLGKECAYSHCLGGGEGVIDIVKCTSGDKNFFWMVTGSRACP